MKHIKSLKLVTTVCAALALTSLSAVAQTTTPGAGMTDSTTRMEYTSDRANYSWIGMLGLLGLAGLLKKRHDDTETGRTRHA